MSGSTSRATMATESPYPPIGDYALIGDCHSAALVSRHGSIDWCCLPRFDSDSCFGRLLDWGKGGYYTITPARAGYTTSRRYREGTLVLETTFQGSDGACRLSDCFTMHVGGREYPHRQLLRIVEGVQGQMEVVIHLAPRFDYGDTRPWICRYGERLYSAIGSNHSLIISGDIDFTRLGRHDLRASLMVRAGERIRISLQFLRPEQLDDGPPRAFDPAELDRRFEETLQWWRTWSSGKRPLGADEPGTLRSAIVLKALAHAPTGAILAAPTTSLPESRGGTRNWDYRYSWIRDSCFTVRALAELGYESEADGFRRFVERSAAGSAEELQIMYGVGGERRLTEVLLDELEGYRGARPVRIGNAAYEQFQLDIYGELLDLAWRWHERGHVPDQDYWRFLVDLVEVAAERWQQPDQGIWEMRGPPQHFVHSKAMCWVALDRGLRLAEAYAREVPVQRWTVVRDQIRAAIESEGYDAERGVFVQAFGSKALDAALLLMPSVGFVAYDDERMRRTVDAIREELNEDGLLVRYRTPDNLDGNEGVFLACSFWLAECLSRQGRRQEARQVFARAVSTSNDVGLFSEEYDVRSGEMLGNFPQGLTHLSHIAAAVALADS